MGATVETRYGKLEGEQQDGIHVFRGIPFARPPVGPLRFRPPQPPEPWGGVRDATRFGASAPQRPMRIDLFPGMGVGPQDEDCLYLNVWTPAFDAAPRAVLVWIHGGAFTIGSGSQSMYDARRLAERGDVVVVTVNYRLGALGFLHLSDVLGPDFAGSGNLGILDQVAALRWVRENIASFGGDPGNVTIFGESAGGMSVGTLLGTPAARGLFQRAIPQSGASHNAHPRERASETTERLLAALGLARGDAGRLRETAAEALLDAQDKVSLELASRSGLAFQPVVDGAVLPERPIDAVRGGLSAGVALLAGATRDEWNLFGVMDPSLARMDEAKLVRRIERSVGPRGSELVRAYRDAREQRSAPADPRSLLLALETDRIFRIPAIRLAEAQAAHEPRTYQYLFTWESPFLGEVLGACHGIDVPFVFGAFDLPGADKFVGTGLAVDELGTRTMDAWLAFAREGDPSHGGLGAWPAYDGERRATMLLGPSCGVEDDPFAAERRAWDGIL